MHEPPLRNMPVTRIRRCSRLGSVLPFCLILFGCLHKTPGKIQDTGAVGGIISDLSGKPVEGAQVYVYKWLYDEESIGEIIREEIDESGSNDYGDYRGPADFKSAKTGTDGNYKISLPPGKFVLVARKRRNQDISQGPLNPDDLSSLVSEPIEVKTEKTTFVYLKLLDTLRDESFFERYLIRTYRTGFSGRVISSAGKPVSGVIVTVNKNIKISRRPDFVSSPTDMEGKYILYVYSGGNYHIGVKRRTLGPYLSFYQKNNPEKKTVSIVRGQITPNLNLVFEEGDKP